MANDWRTKYDPKQHQEIAGFLGANPGDESRIGSALGFEEWDGTTTGDTGAIPGEIDWMPQAPPDLGPINLDSPYGGDPLPPANINDPGGANPLYDQIMGSNYSGMPIPDDVQAGWGPPDQLIDDLQNYTDTSQTRMMGAPSTDFAPPPTDEGYGYSLGFRPSDVDPKYGEMTDAEYLQASGGFPTWESLGTPGLAGMGDPMSLVQNQSVAGLVPAMQEAGYQFRQDPYDTRMAGVPDYNVFYDDKQIPFGLRQTGIGETETKSVEGETERELCELSGGTWDGAICHPPGSVDLDTTLTPQEQCELSGGTWDGFECKQSVSGIQSTEEIVRPKTNLPADWVGEILQTPESIPFQPQAYEDISAIPVGQDPLSQLANAVQASMMTTGGVAPTPLAGNIEQTLQDILLARGQGAEAVSPLGEQVGETASDIIARGGKMPVDVRRRAMEIEAARSPLDILRRSQLEQGQAELASRGLLGQGPELDYMQRLEGRLAPEYARAGQLIELAEREREETRFQNAMELSARTANEQAQLRESRLSNAMSQASGMSQEQSRNLLNTVQSVTERQQMMNDVALQSLDRNMEWNQFLAEFGLERAQVLETIQTGRIAALLPLIQQYLAGVTLASSGFVKTGASTEG